jgi:hypothetical protein
MEPAKSNQSWWIEDRKVLPSLKERKKERVRISKLRSSTSLQQQQQWW